jgi:hypothetical protein
MTNFYRVAKTEIFLSNGQPIPSAPPSPGYHGRLLIENLRVAFSIQKNLAWSTNSCTLRIWNLSADHRNKLRNYGDRVVLYAGYQNELLQPTVYTGSTANTQILFRGDTTTVRHIYDYPDIITSIECGDGERFANQVMVEVSYTQEVTARDVIQDIANRMGITFPVENYNQLPTIVYQTGFSYAGMAKDALTKVCAYINYQYSIQNEVLQIIPVDGALIQPPFVINSDTGMVGVPERYTYKRLDLYRNGPKTGWRVRSTLRPAIIPGSRILLESEHIQLDPGMFRVETIRHEGDTFGPQWFSNVEVTLVS